MVDQKKIYRTFAVEKIDNGGPIPTLRGRAILYNTPSSDCGGWVDVFKPGCFGDYSKQDILALIDHNSNLIVGRTSNGRLRLEEDGEGIWSELDMSNTSYARDTIQLIDDMTVKGMSFGCFILESEWDLNTSPLPTQYVTKAELIEVTITGNPSYLETSIAVRHSLEEARKNADRAVKAIEQAKASAKMKRQIAVKKSQLRSI